MSTIKEDLLAAGPKEVRTPNMTVIAHDPMVIQKINERKATTLPTICGFGGCTSKPKHSAYEPFADRYDCDRAD